MAAREQLSLGLAPDAPERYVDLDDVPDGWRLLRLDQVCEVNPSRKGRTNHPDDLPVSFVPMAAVDEVTGTIAAPDVRPFGAVKKGYTWFIEDDVLFAKITPCMQNGKAAIARGLSNGVGFGSTEFHVLRPGPDVLPEWIHLFVRQPSFRSAAAQHFTGSVGQQRVPELFVATQVVPVPPLSEQRRIVARIEELAAKIERARGLRREAVQDIEVMLPSALADVRQMVADEYKAVPLGELVDVIGGGTPSTQNPGFWNGDIPWVTPKDMKRWEIRDSEDHITQEAVAQSAVRWIESGAVLIVTRGMILARTLPVAIARARITLNQDMKAIRPRRTQLFDSHELSEEYLAYMLRAGKKDILAQVEIAGHGTRRLRTEILTNYPLPLPPMSEQHHFVTYLNNLQANAIELNRLQGESNTELGALLPTMLTKAFRGEL